VRKKTIHLQGRRGLRDRTCAQKTVDSFEQNCIRWGRWGGRREDPFAKKCILIVDICCVDLRRGRESGRGEDAAGACDLNLKLIGLSPETGWPEIAGFFANQKTLRNGGSGRKAECAPRESNCGTGRALGGERKKEASMLGNAKRSQLKKIRAKGSVIDRGGSRKEEHWGRRHLNSQLAADEK